MANRSFSESYSPGACQFCCRIDPAIPRANVSYSVSVIPVFVIAEAATRENDLQEMPADVGRRASETDPQAHRVVPERVTRRATPSRIGGPHRATTRACLIPGATRTAEARAPTRARARPLDAPGHHVDLGGRFTETTSGWKRASSSPAS
jgi:hypothetical protein